MNSITLTFKDKDLESKFNKEEEANQIDKIMQIIIAFILTSVMGMYFYFSKGETFFGAVQTCMLVCMVLLYYFMIYQRRFLQFMTLVIGIMSLYCSTNQLFLVLIKFDYPIEEQRILADATMLGMFSFQLHNTFILNTFQYVIYIVFRIYLSFNARFWMVTSLTLIFSAIIIHNDYVRIKTLRNRFLLKEFNNNQLKMLDNLDQYILLLEFQQQSQRLIEYFVNKAFKIKINNIHTIEFIKNIFIGQNNTLYNVVLQMIHKSILNYQLSVKYLNSSYKVNIQIYKGEKILVALEFTQILKQDVLSKPYFYNALLKYVKKHDLNQYRIEIMKNLCGFLLYKPQKLKLLINFVSIIKIINLAHPKLVRSNIFKEDQLRSNDQLLNLFFYLLKKCFVLQQLELKKYQIQSEIYYKFNLIGSLKEKSLARRQVQAKLNILKTIIDFLGLDDLTFTMSGCSFTLINLENKFLVI